MAKQQRREMRNAEGEMRNGEEGAGAVSVPSAVGAGGGGVSILVPIAPEVSGKYATGRIDTELSRPDAITMRRIQDAMEERGIKCRGTGSVVHFLLESVRKADEAAKKAEVAGG